MIAIYMPEKSSFFVWIVIIVVVVVDDDDVRVTISFFSEKQILLPYTCDHLFIDVVDDIMIMMMIPTIIQVYFLLSLVDIVDTCCFSISLLSLTAEDENMEKISTLVPVFISKGGNIVERENAEIRKS
ncbi:hypothetical protein DERF_005974 [Dermatophagoides farinae]|uniref:Uncharacterized protein n=1 Tax=Dermatophagoides farinae TaxID=6954 RepID=A0A922I803_DERFA|nr:hypothetical protein DERF_005974 [Dermatophagoides farinae]